MSHKFSRLVSRNGIFLHTLCEDCGEIAGTALGNQLCRKTLHRFCKDVNMGGMFVHTSCLNCGLMAGTNKGRSFCVNAAGEVHLFFTLFTPFTEIMMFPFQPIS